MAKAPGPLDPRQALTQAFERVRSQLEGRGSLEDWQQAPALVEAWTQDVTQRLLPHLEGACERDRAAFYTSYYSRLEELERLARPPSPSSEAFQDSCMRIQDEFLQGFQELDNHLGLPCPGWPEPPSDVGRARSYLQELSLRAEGRLEQARELLDSLQDKVRAEEYAELQEQLGNLTRLLSLRRYSELLQRLEPRAQVAFHFFGPPPGRPFPPGPEGRPYERYQLPDGLYVRTWEDGQLREAARVEGQRMKERLLLARGLACGFHSRGACPPAGIAVIRHLQVFYPNGDLVPPEPAATSFREWVKGILERL